MGEPQRDEDEDDDDRLLDALAEACEGLRYPSESDAPFEPFLWGAVPEGEAIEERVVTDAAKRRRKGRHRGASRRVEEVTAGHVFGQLEETEDAAGFKRLRRSIESLLTDVRVFRVGAVKVEVYVVGRTPQGNWAGLRTTSVET